MSTTIATSRDFPRLGILLRVLSGLLMAGMFICVKAVSDRVPVGEIVFFRAFFALIPLIVFLWLRGEFPSGLATRRPGAHLLRAGFGAFALFTAFAALARLNLAEALLIAQLAPLFLAIAGFVLLAEPATRWRVTGVVLGFAGVVIMLWPELRTSAALSDVRLIGVGFGVLSAALSACALIMVRRLNETESPGAIALYFVIASMVLGLLSLPFGWVMPSPTTLMLLVLAGLFGGLGHIAMTLSLRYAQASRLAPYEYLAFLWPLIADLWIFELPLSTTFLLAAVLIFGGAGVASLERSRGPRA